MNVGDVVRRGNQVGTVVSVWVSSGVDVVTVSCDGCRWVWAVSDCVVVWQNDAPDVHQI